MKFVIFLSCFITAQAAVIREQCRVNIEGINYDKETLVSGLDRPFFLDSDYNSDDLYFGYRVQGKPEISRPGRINLKTKEFTDIPDVRDGFAHAINHEGKEIFVGGADGIYKYNIKKNLTTFLGASDKDIWKMYYRDVLYFTAYPEEKLYVFKDGEYSLFNDLADTIALNFVIDDDNVMYFNNDTGLYKQKEGTKDSVVLKECSLFTIRALVINPNGKLYACLKDGIYYVNKDTLELVKLFAIFDAFGLTFDRAGNFIYANSHSVYRLIPNTSNNC